MGFTSLAQWLDWQESLHSKEIDLGLERIRLVAQKFLSIDALPIVITVAGTNGKGSVSSMLSSIYQQAGYRVGLYTSPHLVHYNERICINNIPVTDEQICASFERINKARGDISLSYFEFGTLAALDIFCLSDLDVVVLEVGLGGRLDAVNIAEPDVTIISSIDLDHQSWLGNDRDSIAREKLGVCRPNIPLVIGELDPPQVVEQYCHQQEIPLYRVRQEFAFQSAPVEMQQQSSSHWQWLDREENINALPMPKLRGEHQLINASVAIKATRLLQKRLPVSVADIRKGLLSVNLLGRVQHIQDGEHHVIVDVAHNPQSARMLSKSLQNMHVLGERVAILGMLKDKDIANTIGPMLGLIDRWYVVDLAPPRGATGSNLSAHLLSLGVSETRVEQSVSVATAYEAYTSRSHADDLLVIFGSFLTAADAMTLLVNQLAKQSVNQPADQIAN